MDQIILASFIDRLVSSRRVSIVSGLIVLGLLCVQAIFFYLQNTQVEAAERAIRSVLRQEVVVSNLFLLSRSVGDLQESRLVSCALVRKEGSERPYMDLRYRSSCATGFFNLNGKEVTTRFESLNGESWTISFLANTGRFFSLSLWLARLAIVLVVMGATSFYFHRIDRESRLRREKEIENETLNRLVEQKVAEITQLRVEASVQKSLSEVAQQVSHDIRSPVSALNMVVKRLENIPEEQKRIIQSASDRINDIANDLLKRYRKKSVHVVSEAIVESVVPDSIPEIAMVEVVRAIFGEKSALVSEHQNIQFKLDLTGAPMGAVCRINPVAISRALSNLINNAFEALESQGGTVTLALRPAQGEVAILLSDDGPGIPDEVLSRLGKEQISFGKEHKISGNGIGVLHARQVSESFGGRLSIQSRAGLGTIISIFLPRFDRAG